MVYYKVGFCISVDDPDKLNMLQSSHSNSALAAQMSSATTPISVLLCIYFMSLSFQRNYHSSSNTDVDR